MLSKYAIDKCIRHVFMALKGQDISQQEMSTEGAPHCYLAMKVITSGVSPRAHCETHPPMAGLEATAPVYNTA